MAYVGMDAATGRRIEGTEHLRQSIRDILTTRIGSRPERREYGSALPYLVDRPFSDDLVLECYAAVADAVDRWEPRVLLRRVQAWWDSGLVLDLEMVDRHGNPVTLEGLAV